MYSTRREISGTKATTPLLDEETLSWMITFAKCRQTFSVKAQQRSWFKKTSRKEPHALPARQAMRTVFSKVDN
jgi:hypothetical protein